MKFSVKLSLILLVIFTFPWDLSAQSTVEIDSKTFGAIEARHIGPARMSGRIIAIDAVEKNDQIVYVGAASGGVWKSTDAGTTFSPVFDKHTQSIGAIAIDQNHPDTVWVGTGEGWTRNSVSVGEGIYKTTNGGETWQKMGLDLTERIGRIVINPENPDQVFVAAIGHLWNSNEERGVYRTDDGGKSWEKILYIDGNTGCADISMDPDDSNILYAGMWDFRRKPYTFRSGGPGSGLYKTSDGGENWIKLTEGLPDTTLGRIAVDVSPADANTVYAVVEAADKKTALFRSQNKGESWEEMNKTGVVKDRPFYFCYVVADPVDTNLVYKPGYQFAASKDGGKTFTGGMMGSGSGVHADLHALWISPKNHNFMYLGTDGGVYVSTSQGKSWRMLRNLPLSQFYHVSVDMDKPYNVYGGLQDNGSWFGPSSSPGGIQNANWDNVSGGDGFYVFRDGEDPNIIYSQSQGGNISKLFLKSRERKSIKPYGDKDTGKLRFNWNTPVVFGANSNAMYVGTQYLFRSEDKGDTWVRISPDLTTDDPKKQEQHKSGGVTIDNTSAENHCTIITINESAKDKNIIWVGTDDGNLQVTKNMGETWENVTRNVPDLPANTWCSFVFPDRFDKNTCYVTFDGHRSGDKNPYVYKTTDLGQTWTSLVDENLPIYCHIIIQDLVKPDLLFLGTEFGLYVSIDGGNVWSQFTGNLPDVPVRDMVIHPREHDLVLATHGRGILIVDDITPLRYINDEVINEDIVFLPSRPFVVRNVGSIQEYPGGDEFTGANAPQSALLTYYLKKRHIFGKMTIEVFGPDGELISTLPAGKRRGINRISMNIRKKAPKVPSGKSLSFAGLFGPPLAAGEYTVKVTKNKESVEGKFTIQNDPDLPHTKEDMELQYKTLMKSYDMLEDLAYLGRVISDIQKGTEKAKEGDISKNLKKKAAALNDKVSAINAKLVDTASEGIFTEDVQLREKITEIYSGVLNFLGRPTNSQIDRLNVLESQLKNYENQIKEILENDLVKLNSNLEKAELNPIKITSKEEFENEK